MDGYPASLGKLTVNLAHQKLDFAPQLFVVWNFFAARNHNLQQRDFMAQFWEASQQDTKRLQALWQLLENVRRWKGNMEKETNPGSAARFSQISPHQHQVIVVGPDEVLGGGCFHRRLCELAVYALIKLPIFRVEVAARWHVVKQRPDDLIGEAGIELRYFLLRQRNSLKPIRPPAGSFLQQSRCGLRVHRARPADPEPVMVAPTAVERGGEASGTGVQPRMTGAEFDLDRQAVRDID